MRRILSNLLLLCGTLSVCLGCLHGAAPTEPSAVLPAGSALLPRRVVRLSNTEFERTASELLGAPVSVADRLPPDLRQLGYTRNDAQGFSAALGTRLLTLSNELAEEAVETRLAKISPCLPKATGCRTEFVEQLATRAWRRPITQAERNTLLTTFDTGARGRGFAGGAELVLNALLQSPSLWYARELGQPLKTASKAHPTYALDGYEIASLLAYTLRGSPPDAELLKLASTGELSDATVRVAQARRLLGQSNTREHFRRFILEWLEVDLLHDTAKDPELFPNYEVLKQEMLLETTAFADEVMVHRGASLNALLTAEFTAVRPRLARHYGLKAYGTRVSLSGTRRTGVLQHASFLSAHAHPDGTSPVKRGDFVMRRVLCAEVPRPGELDLEITMPPPDPKRTTRERFTQHASDPNCRYCHVTLDELGYSFEAFDAAGGSRTQDNDKPVDSSANFRLGNQRHSFADSAELSHWLGQNPQAHECFLRQAFRYFSAQADPRVEDSFLHLVRQLPVERRENLFEALLAYVGSDLFVLRRAPAEAAQGGS